MLGLEDLAADKIHVHATGQARIEAPHRAHDINALKFIRTILLEDWGILHRIFVWTGSAVDITRISIPGRRRVGMIVRDLAFANHHMMRQDASHRFVETATNGLFRHFEIRPSLVLPPCSSSMA